MGATKHEIYSKDVNEYAEMFKALAHPARIQALLIISEESTEEVTSETLLKGIKLSQATISYHMKQLRDTGLVSSKTMSKLGKTVVQYRVNSRAINTLQKYVQHLILQSNLKSDPTFDHLNLFFSKFRELDTSFLKAPN